MLLVSILHHQPAGKSRTESIHATMKMFHKGERTLFNLLEYYDEHRDAPVPEESKRGAGSSKYTHSGLQSMHVATIQQHIASSHAVGSPCTIKELINCLKEEYKATFTVQ